MEYISDMILFRVAKTPYSKDLTGKGAQLSGGRWNPKGVPLIYTSETRSLAALEYLAHMDRSIMPAGVKILTIKFNSSCSIYNLDIKALPEDWNIDPYSGSLHSLTDIWLKSKNNFIMKVPSVVIPEEHNYLINPMNPDIKNTLIIDEIDFASVSKYI